MVNPFDIAEAQSASAVAENPFDIAEKSISNNPFDVAESMSEPTPLRDMPFMQGFESDVPRSPWETVSQLDAEEKKKAAQAETSKGMDDLNLRYSALREMVSHDPQALGSLNEAYKQQAKAMGVEPIGIDERIPLERVNNEDVLRVFPNSPKLAAVLTGTQRAAAGLAEGVLSPEGMTAMIAPGTIGKIYGNAFKLQMASSIPDQVVEFSKALGSGDLAGSVESGLTLGATGLMLSEGKSTPKIVEQVRESGAPLTAQALEQKLTEKPISSPAPVEAPKTRAEGESEAVSPSAQAVEQAQVMDTKPAVTEAEQTAVAGGEGIPKEELLGIDRPSIPDESLKVLSEDEFDKIYRDSKKAVYQMEKQWDETGEVDRVALGKAQDRYESASLERFRRNTVDTVPEDLFRELKGMVTRAVDYGPTSEQFQKAKIIFEELKRQRATSDAVKDIGNLTNDAAEVFGGQMKDLKRFAQMLKEGEPKPLEPSPIGEAALSPEKEMAGPGGTTPSDVGASNSEITQLASSVPEIRTARKTTGKTIGQAATDAKTAIVDGLTATKSAFKAVKDKLTNPAKFDDMDKAIGEWSRDLQESSRDSYLAWKKIQKQIPDETRRSAIGAYVDAGGDATAMQNAADTLTGKYGRHYKEALSLTPEEKVFANNIRNYFDSRLDQAKEAGILEDGIENYIRRIYEKESEWKSAALAANRLSTSTPDFARKRVFGTDAEAIKAGYKPIQDFAQRVLTYDQELNRAIADRAFVKTLMARKMPDGRPMIDVGGMGVEVPKGAPESLLIKPQFKPKDASPEANRTDYKPFNHPAFRKWKWIGESDGKKIFLQGDVLVHPDALGQVEKLLSPSAVRANPIGRAALKFSSTMKQTMLDLSGFHQVQIGVHALEHRVVPSKRFGNLVEIDLKEPTQRALVDHGLVISEEGGFAAFGEGLHGNSILGKLPVIGKYATSYHEWLFKEYIPTIKMTMAKHALERNKKAYPKLSEDQVLRLTAEQANSAFGGLNYKMLGRSQTMQDLLRLGFLAPDFLEARGRFAAQALKPFGREQLTALFLGAATLYATARIMNQVVDDNPHWEPENAFSFVYKNHAYGLRTVQGDILHLLSKPGQFWYHRFNPALVRPLIELSTGRDYFGNKVGLGDVLINELKTYIPISLRGMVEGKNQNVLESAMNAFGVTTKRFSAATQIYDKAEKWKKENNIRVSPGEFIYNPEKDPLHDLKVALQYEDSDSAAKEVHKLLESGQYKPWQLSDHFRRYANSPFTGSAVNERKFIETLSAADKTLLGEAKESKKKIYRDFLSALKLVRPSSD